MPCASLTTLTPNSSIVPAKGQLFGIDVRCSTAESTVQKQCEAGARFERTTVQHPCTMIEHMFVADAISPAQTAGMPTHEHASPRTRPTHGGHSSWVTATWRFDIGAVRTSPASRVRSALADLTADLPHLTRGTDLAELLTQLELITRSVEAATVEVMARADRADAFRDDGHGTLTGWVRSIIKWSPSEASARARTATATHTYPTLVERLHAGPLGVAGSCPPAGVSAGVD